jgi:hypothetical protein
MKQFLILLVIIAVGFACGQKESETASSQKEAVTAKEISKEPRQAIPDMKQVLTGTPTLKPYFDEKGTVTEKMVAPGETFDIYIIAGVGEKDHITAAEYKLSLPEGIAITREFDSDSLTMKSGKPDIDIMIAFRCSPGPQFILIHYLCLVEANFTGGTIATMEGEKSNFIGLIDCGPDPVQIPAEKGTAVLKAK